MSLTLGLRQPRLICESLHRGEESLEDVHLRSQRSDAQRLAVGEGAIASGLGGLGERGGQGRREV